MIHDYNQGLNKKLFGINSIIKEEINENSMYSNTDNRSKPNNRSNFGSLRKSQNETDQFFYSTINIKGDSTIIDVD